MLVIVAAGDRSVYEDCSSCFQAMGKTSFFIGTTVFQWCCVRGRCFIMILTLSFLSKEGKQEMLREWCWSLTWFKAVSWQPSQRDWPWRRPRDSHNKHSWIFFATDKWQARLWTRNARVGLLVNVYRILIRMVGTVGKKVFSQPPIVQVLPLKRWERPVIFIIGIPQLWETK